VDLASLGIQVTTSGVTQAATELDKLDKASTKTEKSAATISKSFDQNAKSAKELQFALRGVPAQFTDIATSLSSGQRPLQVFLQQGGQLKDMFGGVGPAAKALGGYVLGLINPLTIGAATLGTFAYALNQAEEDQSAFNKALLISGSYAGKTALQLEAMVSAVASTSDVTQGTAREAIQRATDSGRFAGAQFDLVTRAAARMESATGQSIDSTIKKFEDISKSPVEALLKLNETEHFLTQAQLDRVRALADEGREQDAAAEGARIYADRLDDIATAAEAARPHLARMWADAKKGASDAWEETKNFTEFLAAAADKYKQMPWYKRATPIGIFGSLYGAEPAQAPSVAPVAGTVDTAKARAYAEFQKEGLQYATKQAKLEHDIAQAKADGLKAGASQLEIDQRIAAIRASYADKVKEPRTPRAKVAPDFRAQALREMQAEIEAEGKLMDQRLRSSEAVKAYRAGLQDMLATRQATIDLQVASVGMGQREIAQKQALIAIDEDYNRQKSSLERQQRNSTSEIDKAGFAEQLKDLKAYHDARVQIEKEGESRALAARMDGFKGAQAAVKDFVDQQNNMAGQMEGITSNFLYGFSDAFADFADHTKSAKDAFGSLIDSMERDALKLVANKAMQAVFDSFGAGSTQTPGTTAGGWGSILSNFASYFSSGPGTIGAGLANGGPASAGSIHPVVENGPEILSIGPKSYLLMGSQGGHVTPVRDAGGSSGNRNPTYITNINVQPTSTRRTAEQVASANARTQRVATARNA
jgi:lambda family phage tail tape measure protein